VLTMLKMQNIDCEILIKKCLKCVKLC
jgi:hypothetical protein